MLDWIRPVVSGLIGAGVVWIMVALTKSSGRRVGERRYLEYSRGFKVLALLLVPISVFIAYAAAHAGRGQKALAFLIAVASVVGATFSVYQAFFVKFSYDDDFIYYKTPLAGERRARWAELNDVGYSGLLQSDYIVVKGIGRIWCSNMLNGYAELGEFLEKKTRELFPEER